MVDRNPMIRPSLNEKSRPADATFSTYAELDIHVHIEPSNGGVRLILDGPKMRKQAPPLLGMRLTDGAGKHLGYATFRPVGNTHDRFTYELSAIVMGTTPPDDVWEWGRHFGHIKLSDKGLFSEQARIDDVLDR